MDSYGNLVNIKAVSSQLANILSTEYKDCTDLNQKDIDWCYKVAMFNEMLRISITLFREADIL
jgi:hypothetical protein